MKSRAKLEPTHLVTLRLSVGGGVPVIFAVPIAEAVATAALAIVAS